MPENQPDIPAHRYTPALAGTIEKRWQDRWEEDGTFEVANPSGPWGEAGVAERPKRMVQDMFSYPSGAGLHVGHPLPYIASDVYARYLRSRGFHVLYTQGFDAFGLPAEQHAVATGQHPRKTTEENITVFKRQLRQLGLSYDQRRRIATIDPDYYRWTQWIFLQIFNAWFDERVGKARPITELEAAYAAGEVATPDGRPWSELNQDERVDAIDSRRLAYKRKVPVNWAPGLGTVVANEEVTNEGLTERGDMPVFQRDLSQWMMRITAYADRLTDDLDRVEWPESIKAMQRNWIGRSHGASLTFPLVSTSSTGDKTSVEPSMSVEPSTSVEPVETTGLEVFTTRPDTIFGATFMVVAPEHPVLAEHVPAQWPEGTKDIWTGGAATPTEAVADYQRAASRKSERDRQIDDKQKTGVFTGIFATNPVTGQPVPVFTADYVLMGYGTGAIMAVPGEDERDWDFAAKYDLPHVRTIQPPEGHDDNTAYTGDGPIINSANERISLDGMEIEAAKTAVVELLERDGAGRGTVTYKLRDWLFSRQRYWGEPFPIVYDDNGHAHAIPDDQLPVELPDVADYSPKTYAPDDAQSEPESPLSRAVEWVEVELDLGDGPKTYRRETDTMPNWAGSCWYELRYTDAANAERMVDPEVERYWMGPGQGEGEGAAGDPGGVDLYIGGAEHAVLHLLYARFWHKILHDLGHVSSEEPFRRLFIHGYVQAFAFRDHRGQPVPAAEVEVSEDGESWTWNGRPVSREYGKMGKSLKNVVTPDEMCDQYGADTFRVYEMSMGPLDQSRAWETRAVVGAQRFLQRVWRNLVDEDSGALRVVDDMPSDDLNRLLHRTIAGVREDYDALRFNTAVAKLTELNNALTQADSVPREVAEALVVMVSPLAPHLAEELWERLGRDGSVAFAAFPEADERWMVAETVTCVVQVQGKVRDRVEVDPQISETDLEALARASERVRNSLGDKQIRKVIVRAPKLVNIVAG